MTKPVLPNSQKVQKTVLELQEVCHQFDALNFNLDELITQVDVEIQNSPLTIFLSKKIRETKSA
jgi:hypothetical protein